MTIGTTTRTVFAEGTTSFTLFALFKLSLSPSSCLVVIAIVVVVIGVVVIVAVVVVVVFVAVIVVFVAVVYYLT